jgi:hypothetical protein
MATDDYEVVWNGSMKTPLVPVSDWVPSCGVSGIYGHNEVMGSMWQNTKPSQISLARFPTMAQTMAQGKAKALRRT